MTGITAKGLIRIGARTTMAGVAATVVATMLVLAMIPIEGSGSTPPPVAALALAILSTPLMGFALMVEGSARGEHRRRPRLASRFLAVMLATSAIALLVAGCAVLMQ